MRVPKSLVFYLSLGNESEEDVLTDFDIYSPEVSVLNSVKPNSYSPYKGLKFKIFRNTEILAPFAKIKLKVRE